MNSRDRSKRPLSAGRPTNLSLDVFGVFVALTLWTSVESAPLWAQDSKPVPLAAIESIEKSNKATGTTGHKSGANHGTQAASTDSKEQNSQTPFGSLANSNRGPVSIQSDSLALDYKQSAVHFNGHVRASQADGTLTSNTLRVKYGKDFHEVKDMAADGDVRISQGVRWCTSDHAVLDQSQHTVILTGSPVCHDAQDQIAGTRITVHLDSGKSDVEAARAMIFPQQSKTRDNEALANKSK